MQKLISHLSRSHRAEIKEVRIELDEERSRTKLLSENFESQKKDLQERLEIERKHSREQKKILENALEDAKVALSGNNQEFGEIQNRLRQENLELRQEINTLKNRLVSNKQAPQEVNAAELQSLKEILKEFHATKLQKSQLEQEFDYEMKLQRNF